MGSAFKKSAFLSFITIPDSTGEWRRYCPEKFTEALGAFPSAPWGRGVFQPRVLPLQSHSQTSQDFPPALRRGVDHPGNHYRQRKLESGLCGLK